MGSDSLRALNNFSLDIFLQPLMLLFFELALIYLILGLSFLSGKWKKKIFFIAFKMCNNNNDKKGIRRNKSLTIRDEHIILGFFTMIRLIFIF